MSKTILIIISFVGLCCSVKAQGGTNNDTLNFLEKRVVDGDTILVAKLDEVYIMPPKKFKNRFEAWRYRRLIRNVKKAYPYAITARDWFEEVNTELEKLETEKERDRYMKSVENDLLDQYEGELKKLTITQGRILLKLIDREIGKTSYDLLKEYRGSVSAFFWQTLARIFGNNLKSEFDAEGEDKLIEQICIYIESGLL